MGVRKRFTALLIVIIMLFSNLRFPLQSVVYGFGEPKTINFHGDNLVVNGDGSVTFDCNLEDNQGRITIAVYNSENEKKNVEAQLMWDEQTQTNVPNQRDAWVDLETESYEGCYLIVTSDGNVDLGAIKFDLAGHNMFVQNEGRVDLPGEVEHINIDENTVRSKYEKKQVRFEGDNLVVNGVESVTLDCPTEGNEGRLTFELYNSDNTKVNINRRMMWNDETQQEEPNEREAEGILNTTTYEGAYLVVTSDGNVDLTDVMFDFAGRMCTVNGDGRVYLPSDLDDIIVDEHSMREAIEKKRVEFEDDNLEVNADGTVTMDCNLKNNTGRITIAAYNSDDSQVNIRRSLMWDDEEQHEVESETRAEGKLKTTTYEGAYLVVTSDGNVDLSNVKFDIAGNEVFIQAGGRVDLPNVEGFCIDKYSIKSIVFDTVDVTVTATATEGNFDDIWINDTSFNINLEGEPNGPTNTIEQTLEVEDRDNDRIIIEVEHGKIVSSVKINDEDMVVNGYTSRVEYELPHQSTYTIEVVCDVDENVVPEFIWVYNAELAEGHCNAIKHAKVEIVSVTLPDGITTYGIEELGFEDTPGIGMHPIHSNAYVEEDEQMGFGRLCAPAGSTIVIKVVPDKGHKVTSTAVLGEEMIADGEVANQYSFVMPDVDRCFLDATVEETEKYGVWVNGEQFAEDVATITCGEGTATFDKETNTLTLNNATISNSYEYQPWYEAMIYSTIPQLTINLVGTNILSSTNMYADGIDAASGCDVIIQGEGTLNIENAYYGTYIGSWDAPGGNLTINDATVNVNSNQCAGIWVNKDISFNNCHVNVNKTNSSYNGIVSNVDGTITITDSEVVVNSVRSCIHMGNTDDTPHNVVLNSGKLTLVSSEDYGIFVQPKGSDNLTNGRITINGGEIETTTASGGTNLPEGDIILGEGINVLEGASLLRSGHVVIKRGEPALPFPDVIKGQWYYPYVKYVYEHGLMSGYTAGDVAGLFGTNDQITRGQIVTILYRMEGQPEVTGTMNFSDVKNKGEYYYNPVKWAATNGIVTGYKEGPNKGKFLPNNPITREEFAIILKRYAAYKGKDTTQTADLTQFGDYRKVSDWAVKELKWAVGVGIISGNKDTAIPTIKPQGNATRAEAATMITRFCENI